MKFIFPKILLGFVLLAFIFNSCFKDELLKEIDDLRGQLTSIQKRNDSLNSVLNIRADSLSKALASAQKRSDSLSNVLKTKSDSLSNALGLTNANLATLTKSVDSIKTQIVSINSQLTQLNTQLATITSQLASLNQQFNSLGGNISDLSGKYDTLNTSLLSINIQIATLQSDQLKLIEKLNLIIQQLNTPTPQTPTILLRKINFISGNNATAEGNITSNGSAPIIEKGFCWSINPNPTVLDNKTSDGASIGIHKSMINNLLPNTLYYIRAYATNSVGTSYSDQQTFRTLNLTQISDVEGTVYNTIQIGNQVWMKENLNTTTFNDGTPIPVWNTYGGTGYNFYANNPVNGSKYGLIYKYYTMADPKGVCPIGWHVPSEAEWKIMINYLGGAAIAGDKLKESGQVNWVAPSSAATNESGFTALPGGQKDCSMNFVNLGTIASFWSSDLVVGGWVKGIVLSGRSSEVVYGYGFDCNASYIRCVKN